MIKCRTNDADTVTLEDIVERLKVLEGMAGINPLKLPSDTEEERAKAQDHATNAAYPAIAQLENMNRRNRDFWRKPR